MGAGKLLWGWYKEGVPPIWVPLQVDADGKVIVDMSAIGLNDLGDVSVAAPGDHNIIDWDAATSKWVKRALGDMGAHHARHEFGGADPADFTDWLKQDRAVIVHENGSNFGNATLWIHAESAGMTFTQGLAGSRFVTDATANRTGYLYTTSAAFVSGDWFHWIVLTTVGASDSLIWLWISNTLGASLPSAAQKCAGFKLEDGKIYSYSADGVGEESNEIAVLGVSNTSYMLRRNGATVEFYVNGVLEATHTTRIPSGVQQVKLYLTNKANVAKHLYIRTIGIRRV